MLTLNTKIKIRENQNLWDIALQELGTIEAAYDIAELNNIAISDSLTPGSELLIPSEPTDNSMLTWMKLNKIQPATNN